MTRQEALTTYFESVIDNIADQQIRKGIYASGKSLASLQYVIDKEKGTGVLTGDETFFYQVNGRGPGGLPPIAALMRWVAIKRVNISPWAIAKKIAKEGTAIYRGEREGLNMKEALTQPRPQLMKDLAKAIKEDIQKQLRNAIRTN